MKYNLKTLKSIWITGTRNEIMAEIERIEAELREKYNKYNMKSGEVFYRSRKARLLIKEILGSEDH